MHWSPGVILKALSPGVNLRASSTGVGLRALSPGVLQLLASEHQPLGIGLGELPSGRRDPGVGLRASAYLRWPTCVSLLASASGCMASGCTASGCAASGRVTSGRTTSGHATSWRKVSWCLAYGPPHMQHLGRTAQRQMPPQPLALRC